MVQDAKKLKDAVTALCARHGGGGVGGVGDEEQQEVDTEKSEVVPDWNIYIAPSFKSFQQVVRQKEFLEKTVVTLKSQLNQVKVFLQIPRTLKVKVGSLSTFAMFSKS